MSKPPTAADYRAWEDYCEQVIANADIAYATGKPISNLAPPMGAGRMAIPGPIDVYHEETAVFLRTVQWMIHYYNEDGLIVHVEFGPVWEDE